MQFGISKYLGSILLNLGRIQLAKGNKDSAASYFHRAIDASRQNYLRGVAAANLALSQLYLQSGRKDSCRLYAYAGLRAATEMNVPNLILRADTTCRTLQIRPHKDSILKYRILLLK
jgi:Tfp pilus assembly protein PilF